MPDPSKFTPGYDYTSWQSSNPTKPLPGNKVDQDFANVATSIDEIVDAVKDVRRSDGKLKNGIVTVDSLDATVAAGVGSGALASAEAAAASADAASDSAVAAAASATAADGSATAASGYASTALTYRNAASGFADDSAAAATLSQTARDFANKWAVEAEGVLVDDGVNDPDYSAYHWAQVALGAATGALPDNSVSTSKIVDANVTTAKLADGILSADATGRAKMADGFLSADTAGRAKVADGFVNTAKLASGVLSADTNGRAKMADGFLSADTAGRAKMADGFVNTAKIANAVTLTSPTINTPSGEFLRGYINGLRLSNNTTDATNDIDIAAGSAGSDGTTPVLMTLVSALTKRLDASWAVGNGNGGLDTGTIANATYYLWLIRRSDTGVVDALFSLSRTSPTMPTNYDQKAYIGAIVRSGGAITPFKQLGRHFYLVTPRQEFDSTGTGSYVNLTINAPPNTIARVVANANNGANYFIAILPTDTSAPSSLSATGWNMMSGVGASYDGGEYLVPTDGNAQIKHAATSGTAYRIYLMGWEDPGLKI